jgi:hypothetical protein
MHGGLSGNARECCASLLPVLFSHMLARSFRLHWNLSYATRLLYPKVMGQKGSHFEQYLGKMPRGVEEKISSFVNLYPFISCCVKFRLPSLRSSVGHRRRISRALRTGASVQENWHPVRRGRIWRAAIIVHPTAGLWRVR